MSARDGRSCVRPHRVDAHGASGGPSALLAAVRDGGELRGLAGLQDAAGVRELAPGDEATVAIHSEDPERGHRGLPPVRSQTSVGMAHVSHVRDAIDDSGGR